jgi:PAS domain S-box-containing protein
MSPLAETRLEAIEGELRNSRHFIEKVSNAIPGLVAVYNIKTGNYIFVNKSLKRLLGYEAEELLRGGIEFIIPLVHPDDLSRIMEQNRKAVEAANSAPAHSNDDMPVNFEYRLRHKNGTWVWVQTTGVVFDRDEQGEIDHVLNISIDISERKTAEEKLRQSELKLQRLNEELEKKIADRTAELSLTEERFRLLSLATNDAVWDWNLETGAVWRNAGYTHLFGYTEKDLVDSIALWEKNIHPEDKERALESLERAIASKSNILLAEYRFRRADGTYAYVLDRGYLLYNEKGKAYRMVGAMQDISTIREKEERLREAQRLAKMGTWDYDVATGKVSWTDEIFRIHGLDPVKGEPTYQELVSYFERPEELSNRVDEAMNKGIPYAFDTAIITPTGEKKYIHAIGRPVMNSAGKCTRLYGATIDITDQKVTEQALRDSEEEYRSLAEATAQIVWSSDPVGNIQDMPAWREYTGQTAEEVKGFGWINAIHPDDKEIVLERWNEAVKAKKKCECTYRVRSKNGVYRYFFSRSVAILDTEGRIKKWVGTTADIHEQRMAQERFKTLADNLPKMVWETDPGGKTIFTNKYFYEYTGLTSEGVHHQGWSPLIHPDDMEENKREWLESMQAGTSFEFEHRVRRKDGEYRWHLSRVKPIKGDKGEILSWIGSDTDIHDQKMVAEELEKRVTLRTQELLTANEELMRSNNDLEQFAYVASHDLKEPIRMISSYAMLLGRKYKGALDSDADEYLKYITDGASRMQSLINDLLDYSRIGTGTTEKRMEVVDIADVIEQAKSMLHEKIEINGAQIICENLPDKIPGIESQLIQLFQNLLGNAIKFRSEKTPVIIIRCERDGNYYTFYVEDNGIGFDNKYADRIFVIFQRLHTRDKYAGTGIGLAICKKIIDMHGGRIEASSVPGEGTSFRFTLAASHKDIK